MGNDFDKPFFSKNEYSGSEGGLLVKDKSFATERHNVRCPKRNFCLATTAECFDCAYFKGFFPANRDKPISDKNLWALCNHPIGRAINYIPRENEEVK